MTQNATRWNPKERIWQIKISEKIARRNFAHHKIPMYCFYNMVWLIKHES
jgi:hypothetical protein